MINYYYYFNIVITLRVRIKWFKKCGDQKQLHKIVFPQYFGIDNNIIFLTLFI